MPPPGYPPAGYPPPYGQPYGWPPYGQPGYPQPWPPWGWAPARPRRPGQVIGAAVLAFVQAGLVLFASMYAFLFASVLQLAVDSGGTGFSTSRATELATEGRVLALVQLGSVVLLVVAGILALSRRTRSAWLTLLLAMGLQVLLALYWALRLSGTVGDGLGLGEAAPLTGFALFFAAGPLVASGLVAAGPGRRWFAGDQPA